MSLMDMEPDNEKIYFNLGMLSMDDKKYEEAKVWFDKAIEVVIDLFLNLLLIVEFAVVLLISRYGLQIHENQLSENLESSE